MIAFIGDKNSFFQKQTSKSIESKNPYEQIIKAMRKKWKFCNVTEFLLTLWNSIAEVRVNESRKIVDGCVAQEYVY